MKIIQYCYRHYKICRSTNSSFGMWLFYRLYYFLFKGLHINKHQKVLIKGLKNITIKKSLTIGMNPEGFISKHDQTYLNIQGKFLVKGSWSIGRGCRLFVAPGGSIEVGHGGYVNSFTNFMIGNRLVIGDNSIISWNCQFLNEGTHEIEYEGKNQKNKNIVIGNNVWIGNNVKIYEGSIIPDNCVVASDSVIKKAYSRPNVLIGGNPSKILREDVIWKL